METKNKTRNELKQEIRRMERAMFEKCVDDCSCGQKRYNCEITDCALYPYRWPNKK